MSHPWLPLVAHAIMGTDRRPFKRPAAPGRVGEQLALVNELDSERALLDALALAGLHWRAGQAPPTLHREASLRDAPRSTLHASLPDDRPRCTPLAAQHLRMMLSDQYAELLPEWLDALARAGLRVPEEKLPELLERGRARVGLLPAIHKVAGQRGHWLAAQNPDWDFGVDLSHPESVWDTGRRAARLALLEHLRPRDPARARALVVRTWKEENAGDRAAFVSKLALGPSADDEEFLEAALDDRSKEVRRAAADVLAGLPQSRLCQRMQDRLQPLVTLERGRLGAKKLKVTLPTACDDGMIRDGVDSKPKTGRGDKAWWLLQMLAACPPTFWNQTLKQSPAELVKLAGPTEWRNLLLDGWARAAARYHETAWAEAVLDAVLLAGRVSAGFRPRWFTRWYVPLSILALYQFVAVLQIALFFRDHVAEAFRVSSRSMSDTLIDGDRFLVEKLLPWEPARGDVVVYRTAPDGSEVNFVHRIVGLPGERVEVRGSRAWIDGRELEEPYVRDDKWHRPDFGPVVVPFVHAGRAASA